MLLVCVSWFNFHHAHNNLYLNSHFGRHTAHFSCFLGCTLNTIRPAPIARNSQLCEIHLHTLHIHNNNNNNNAREKQKNNTKKTEKNNNRNFWFLEQTNNCKQNRTLTHSTHTSHTNTHTCTHCLAEKKTRNTWFCFYFLFYCSLLCSYRGCCCRSHLFIFCCVKSNPFRRKETEKYCVCPIHTIMCHHLAF